MSSLRTTTCDALFVPSENRVMFFWSQPFDNIIHQGNISNDPSIDIFHFLIFVSKSHVHMDVVKMVILNGEEESRLPFKIV